MNTNVAIDRNRARTDKRCELPGGTTPRKVHLKVPVLRMEKSGRARNVDATASANGRDTQRVARHVHRRRQARQLLPALELWEAASHLSARPQAAADGRHQQTRHTQDQDPDEPTHRSESSGSDNTKFKMQNSKCKIEFGIEFAIQN